MNSRDLSATQWFSPRGVTLIPGTSSISAQRGECKALSSDSLGCFCGVGCARNNSAPEAAVGIEPQLKRPKLQTRSTFQNNGTKIQFKTPCIGNFSLRHTHRIIWRCLGVCAHPTRVLTSKVTHHLDGDQPNDAFTIFEADFVFGEADLLKSVKSTIRRIRPLLQLTRMFDCCRVSSRP